MGYGVIRAASAAGRHNHDGMLSLEPRYLDRSASARAATTRVEVTMNPTLPVSGRRPSRCSTKPPRTCRSRFPGLIMTGVNKVRWGRNITLGPGFTFTRAAGRESRAAAPVC